MVTENEMPYPRPPERNWGLAFLASPPPSEQSGLCAGSEWAQCATLTGPVCPAEGEQPKLPAYSETRPSRNLRHQPLS